MESDRCIWCDGLLILTRLTDGRTVVEVRQCVNCGRFTDVDADVTSEKFSNFSYNRRYLK